ncbi:MAG TPA: thioredoxin domain-containing protein, partial [Acidimicrobiales bacterium]|nr:thioredoxin domain-containing protein [Acidimicrobiales bacterium]
MNRLADETSPYLRQHADNPVDWFPWGDDAFAEARRRDVPVMVSVGYSACHWCHVMAHESFEDPATAAVMNERFVNVKVDREERPDVDAIYMEAVQAMTGHGGWPMTVFVDHDGRPFFGGTYFPPTRRGGMPSFVELLDAIDEAWRTKRDDIADQAARLTEAIAATADQLTAADELPGAEVLDAALAQLRQQFDAEWGGFGGAPKFPQTMSLELALRAHRRSGDPDTLAMVERSLDAMAAGGIHDHLGGGFARYSVDRVWLVPHFEKMLYDQALLARVYLHAWQVTGRGDHRRVLDGIVDYVLRDLRHPDGGFFSAEDAASEGVEGKFYVWDAAEVDEVLGDDAAAFRAWFGVTDDGNFEDRNILFRPEIGNLAAPPEVERARARLFAHREQRVRPGLDDKVLTEWNALMLATLAEAAAVTGRDDWRAAAVANGEFLLANLRRDDGRWLRSWQAGDGDRPAQARHLAYAVDHAALVD